MYGYLKNEFSSHHDNLKTVSRVAPAGPGAADDEHGM
jgi:hypothetical protein